MFSQSFVLGFKAVAKLISQNVNQTANQITRNNYKNKRQFILTCFLLIATISSFIPIIPVQAAVQVLGGIDMNAGCRAKWNGNGTSRLIANNVYGWKCGDLPLDLNRACREQYANTSAYANKSGNGPFDWFCAINSTKIGGINLDQNCKSMYGASSQTENKSPANAFNWRCGLVDIDTNQFCRALYNQNAISRFKDQNNAYSWECYQNAATNVVINSNLNLNDRVVYNPVKPPLFAWNAPCGRVLQGRIFVSIQGTVIEARNQVATCYGGRYTWNRVRFDNGVIGWVASQFLQKIVQPVAARCNVPSQSFCVEYFNNKNLSGNPNVVKDDGGKPRWEWGVGSPAGIQSDNFSGQWLGDWYFENGDYQFTIAADDGIRVWINGEQLVNKWYPQASVFTFNKTLTEGKHNIKIHYFESGGSATLKFDWQKLTPSFNIEDTIPVNASFANTADNNDGKGKNVDATTRNVKLRMVGAPGSRKSGLARKWDGQSQVWFVIHGWDNDSGNSLTDANIDKVADKLARARPNDVVFVLDWGEASANSGATTGGNFRAAKWIRPVAQEVQKKLTTWGLNSGQLSNANFIGHSLGSFVSSEIAFNLNQEVKGMSKVNTIIALDPASEINAPATFASCDKGYDLDGRSSVCDRPRSFNDQANFSRAFVGRNSFAGSYARAETARESYILDYGNNVDAGDEHAYVVETFMNMIKNSSDPINNIDRSIGIIQNANNGNVNGINKGFMSNWRSNSFAGMTGPEDFEGIIFASSAKNSTREPDQFNVKGFDGITYFIAK